MEHQTLIRSARRWLLLAACALAGGSALLTWTRTTYGNSPATPSGTLLCTGTLTQSPRMDWGKQTIEFSLPYGPGVIGPLKSDLQALDAPLRIEMDENGLKATETQPRLPVAGNVLRITALQISRKTGRFSLRAEMTRDVSGLLVGAAVWEGTCAPSTRQDRKF